MERETHHGVSETTQLGSLFTLRGQLKLSWLHLCFVSVQVYLHVITYNLAAIRFYESNQFKCLRTLPGTYTAIEKFWVVCSMH